MVGIASAAAIPLPHQQLIAVRAVETYPRGYLLADEVGLGKTIEAGLILRELLLSGRIKTALLLVPASVHQWQAEKVIVIGYPPTGPRNSSTASSAPPATVGKAGE